MARMHAEGRVTWLSEGRVMCNVMCRARELERKRARTRAFTSCFVMLLDRRVEVHGLTTFVPALVHVGFASLRFVVVERSHISENAADKAFVCAQKCEPNHGRMDSTTCVFDLVFNASALRSIHECNRATTAMQHRESRVRAQRRRLASK